MRQRYCDTYCSSGEVGYVYSEGDHEAIDEDAGFALLLQGLEGPAQEAGSAPCEAHDKQTLGMTLELAKHQRDSCTRWANILIFRSQDCQGSKWRSQWRAIVQGARGGGDNHSEDLSGSLVSLPPR